MIFESFAVPTQWTLEDALELIRALQSQTRQFNYHLCLGGGVLNNGRSEKDLDLYFLPLGEKPAQPDKLIEWLEGMWGRYEHIGGPETGDYPDDDLCSYRVKFKYGQQRVDVFVIGSGTDAKMEEETITETIYNPPQGVAATTVQIRPVNPTGTIDTAGNFWRTAAWIPTNGIGAANNAITIETLRALAENFPAAQQRNLRTGEDR